ncbi:hypothetical protein ACHQM5_001735 [Ranunculus cassubicifolius]
MAMSSLISLPLQNPNLTFNNHPQKILPLQNPNLSFPRSNPNLRLRASLSSPISQTLTSNSLQESLKQISIKSKDFCVTTVFPWLMAAIQGGRQIPKGHLVSPLAVVGVGLAKWIDIYSGILMLRVLLSWFPNISWDRWPLTAIRDLCDPYLGLFRNIIPPVLGTMDVSPLLAFAVLGTLGSLLNSRAAY